MESKYIRSRNLNIYVINNFKAKSNTEKKKKEKMQIKKHPEKKKKGNK